MKKVHTLIVLSLLMVCSLFAGSKKSKKVDAARLNEVIVYTYDSFCGEWGSGPEIAKLFEAKTGIKVTFMPVFASKRLAISGPLPHSPQKES